MVRQACVKASTSPSISRLPYELIDMIANELKDNSYRKKIHKWLTVRNYLENLETDTKLLRREWTSLLQCWTLGTTIR